MWRMLYAYSKILEKSILIAAKNETTVKPRFTAQFGGTEKGAVNRGKR